MKNYKKLSLFVVALFTFQFSYGQKNKFVQYEAMQLLQESTKEYEYTKTQVIEPVHGRTAASSKHQDSKLTLRNVALGTAAVLVAISIGYFVIRLHDPESSALDKKYLPSTESAATPAEQLNSSDVSSNNPAVQESVASTQNPDRDHQQDQNSQESKKAAKLSSWLLSWLQVPEGWNPDMRESDEDQDKRWIKEDQARDEAKKANNNDKDDSTACDPSFFEREKKISEEREKRDQEQSKSSSSSLTIYSQEISTTDAGLRSVTSDDDTKLTCINSDTDPNVVTWIDATSNASAETSEAISTAFVQEKIVTFEKSSSSGLLQTDISNERPTHQAQAEISDGDTSVRAILASNRFGRPVVSRRNNNK